MNTARGNENAGTGPDAAAGGCAGGSPQGGPAAAPGAQPGAGFHNPGPGPQGMGAGPAAAGMDPGMGPQGFGPQWMGGHPGGAAAWPGGPGPQGMGAAAMHGGPGYHGAWPGMGVPPYPPGYAAAPGAAGGFGPGPGPGAGPGPGPQAGFGAALGNIAEQNGLGMFRSLFNFDDDEFWKGAAVGAALVLLLTNENLRNSLIGGAAKTAEAVKAGFAGFADGDGAAADDSTQE